MPADAAGCPPVSNPSTHQRDIADRIRSQRVRKRRRVPDREPPERSDESPTERSDE